MKKIILFLMVIGFSSVSFGQAKCGFDEKLKEHLAADPQYQKNLNLNEQKTREFIAAHPFGRPGVTTAIINIPVVIHVMHTGGAVGTIYNPSDATILGAITYLNQVYGGTYAGMEPPVGGATVLNMELNFVLAQRTPSCGFTNGIDRVDASSIPNYSTNGINFQATGGCSELTLKDFARWSPSDYYNIWVVNKIDGADGTSGQFWAGFATFPGGASNLDGTVMLATQMATGKKTLPHEIGHAFNLYHPFQGSSLNTDCPVNATCGTQGDLVCDTDPITYNVNGSGVFDFTCRTGTNTCTGTAYTKNTEHNFMNYTNCFTLFTDGQKARVQAATTLASRVSLANSVVATPCGTVINFGMASDIKTENNTGTATGCRKYTDYNYQMTIGAAPSATATATLTFSGIATKGLDYDVTTNGSFISPSNTLTFATGSTTSQIFTVRVFDDAATESAETAIMNFTLNNGGGNATTGTTIPAFTLTINDNDGSPVAGATLSGGVGTFNISLNQPFRSSNFDARTQILYTAAELTSLGFFAGNITSIGFNVTTKGSTQPFNGLTIKLKNTATAALGFGAFETGTTIVYGPTAYSTISGVNTIPVTPFLWDGSSNLLVEFCWDNSTASGDDLIQGATSTANTFFDRQSTNATPGCSIASAAFSFGTSSRPIITFGITTTATTISTALNSTKTAYLGPNEDVYFYDGSNNLLARIKNLTSFDYGCTQVTIDRAGSSSSQFWNNTPANYLLSKSIKVVPTNNTAAGHYQITLYYTAAEVNGWQSATLQTWANAKMIKISNGFYIPDVTPSVMHINDASVITAAPLTYGSNFNITGDFNATGFSGFGTGIPGNPNCPAITVTNPVTTTGLNGVSFSQNFTQTGSVGGATFSLNAGSLPTGLTLSAGGALTGTPTQTGSFPITVKVTDGNGCAGIGTNYTLVISNCAAIAVTNPATTTGLNGVTFSQSCTQTGAVGGATFTLNSGTLSTGLTLSAAGLLSGTPTQTGSFPITVKVTGGNGCTGIGTTYTLVISNCAAITVANPATTTGLNGVAFSQSCTQTGAVGGATFTLNSGTLPTGLTLSAAGLLSGTPTQTGSFPITVKVTGGNGCTGIGTTYTLVISNCAAITVANPATTTGLNGVAFSQSFTQTGAAGGATFTLNSGTLPTGLSLSAAGLLSGTPTQTGSFPITVKVTGGNGCTGIGTTYTLVISNCAAITVANPATTTGLNGVAFSQSFTQTGAAGGATFTLNSGTLPTGLTLSASGLLSGTPTQTGSFPITVKVTGGNGCTGIGTTYTLVISNCAAITVANPATTTGLNGVAFSQSFTQTGAAGGATFTLNSGTLPTGLTLSASGLLSGTPTQTGSFPITVKVTGGNGCTGIGTTYTLVISNCAAITVTNPATTTGLNGVAFSQSFTQTGAIGGATYSLHTGTLPAGLTLSPVGVLSGTPTQTGTFPITVKVTGGNGCVGIGPVYNLSINASTTIKLNLKIYLEGFLYNGLPMSSNFSNLDPMYPDPTIADSILVNLWSPGGLSNPLPDYSFLTVLHTDGTDTVTIPGVAGGKKWYISVISRNHIETWSKDSVLLLASTNYDFTTGLLKAYDDGVNPPMKQMPDGGYAFWAGDLFQDGAINGQDMNEVDNRIGNFAYEISDINGDGSTDGQDMNFIDNNSTLNIFYARPY